MSTTNEYADKLKKFNEYYNTLETSKNIIKIGATPSKYSGRNEYINNIKKWCYNNRTGEFIISCDYIWFENKDDALKFKLAMEHI